MERRQKENELKGAGRNESRDDRGRPEGGEPAFQETQTVARANTVSSFV